MDLKFSLHKKCANYHNLLIINSLEDFSSWISTNFCTVIVEKFVMDFFGRFFDLLIKTDKETSLKDKSL